MLKIVARYAETWNSFGTVDEMRERGTILDDCCQAIGRDPATLRRSLYGWASLMPIDPWASAGASWDMLGRYRDVGVSEFIIDAPHPQQFGMLDKVASDVLPTLRAERT